MTRNKILIEARQLFYEKGIANVRLQQIADKSGISVCNLAYQPISGIHTIHYYLLSIEYYEF